MPATAKSLIESYYAAFNAGQPRAMLDLLTPDVVHDINQGKREAGREKFAAFLDHMNISYREHLTDIVVMASADGTRAAAEFVVHGEYLLTDSGLPPAHEKRYAPPAHEKRYAPPAHEKRYAPPAHEQRYVLPAGAFFEIRDGLIARVTNYYNLEDWLAQIGAA